MNPTTPSEGPAATTLDRAWAATRPDDLAPEAFDRIWSHVLQSVATSPTLPGRPTLIARVGPRLLQAAAVVLAAWLVARSPIARRPRPIDRPPVEVVAAPVRPDALEIEVDELVVIKINAGGTRTDVRRVDSDLPAELALNLPVSALNSSDMLNTMESMAQ